MTKKGTTNGAGYLRQVNRSNLLLVQKLRAVDDKDTPKVPFLAAIRSLLRRTLGLRETNESLNKELTRVTLLSILRYPPKYYGRGSAGLDGNEFRSSKELGGGRVDEGLPRILIKALDTAVERYSRLLVRLR